ncbi:lipopolysaccharide biosynthesis protein [Bacteroides sp.]|uniref:lipopolysaccharide biosynthesis protein n=1 Tax=Bacteroides sp. TaxID=29523 RepID=UPI0025902003|nr:lipopolysaccharide biosynthesis protein [Bacteroides sp.]
MAVNESITNKSISGIKWSAIERFGVQGIQFIISLILARILSPSDYGIIGMLTIFMAISQTIIDSGFSKALIQKQDRTETDFSTAFYFNIAVGIVCYIILFCLSPYIAEFFNEPILKDVLRVLAINIFINSLAIVPVAKLSINVDFKTQSKASIISAVVSGILGIVLAYRGIGVWALVVQSVSYSLINVVLLWYLLKWLPQCVYSWESFKNLFGYGSNILFASILHTIYTNFTTLAIGKFYSSKDLGFYTRGNQFPSILSLNITNILQRVTFPILSQIQNDTDRLIAVYREYIRVTSLGIFFLLSLLASLGKPLIIFLLTDKWAEAVIYLQIFCFSLMFDHICQINLNLLYVKGNTKYILRLEIIKKTISFIILLISIPFGVLAICISNVIYTQIAVYINTYYTGKFFKFGYVKQIKDFMPYLLISQIACIPCWILQATEIQPLLVLIVGGIISPIIYILILYIKKDDILKKHIKRLKKYK